MPDALENGFQLFKEYCKSRGKSTSITHFNLQTLKISSLFGIAFGRSSRSIYQGLRVDEVDHCKGCNSSHLAVAKGTIVA